MTECLDTASESSYASIVFPALGTGNLGYPRKDVAAEMCQAVLEFDNKATTTQLKEIKLVCYSGDPETLEVNNFSVSPLILFMYKQHDRRIILILKF